MTERSMWTAIKTRQAAHDSRSDHERDANQATVSLRFDLAQLVYDLRTSAGLTQRQLADRMRTTQSVISRLEQAGRLPTLEMLGRIAAATDADLRLLARHAGGADADVPISARSRPVHMDAVEDDDAAVDDGLQPWDTRPMTSLVKASRDPGGLRTRLEARRSDIIAISDRHGARNVRLFGSVARGDHTEASDIDLLVDLDDGVGLFQLGGLVVELEELLQTHVDIVSAGALRPWDGDVLAEAVPL